MWPGAVYVTAGKQRSGTTAFVADQNSSKIKDTCMARNAPFFEMIIRIPVNEDKLLDDCWRENVFFFRAFWNEAVE